MTISSVSYQVSLGLVLEHEGGYVNHPEDPGGETNFGISKRSYPDEDIAGMTLERAERIYYEDFWIPSRSQRLPHFVAMNHFDMAVHSNPTVAARQLQAVLGVKVDGIIGDQTVEAAWRLGIAGAEGFILAYNRRRFRFLRRLPTWGTFGEGWTARLLKNTLRTAQAAWLVGECEALSKSEDWGPLGMTLATDSLVHSGRARKETPPWQT